MEPVPAAADRLGRRTAAGAESLAERLERHRKTVERLIFFGQLFMLVASHPDFDDSETAEMIRANLEVLRDKLRMYHRSISRRTG